jgi:hypothetical protein
MEAEGNRKENATHNRRCDTLNTAQQARISTA